MASTTLCASLKSPSPPSFQQQRRRDAVYVASVPLRAANGPPQLLMSAAYSLGLWELQHFIVIIKPNPSQSKVIVFDFQPREPENLYVALSVLFGRQVPGIVLRRRLSTLPKNRCWFVGFSHADGVEVADKFNEGWPTDLIVGKHDCRHYTADESLEATKAALKSVIFTALHPPMAFVAAGPPLLQEDSITHKFSFHHAFPLNTL